MSRCVISNECGVLILDSETELLVLQIALCEYYIEHRYRNTDVAFKALSIADSISEVMRSEYAAC